MAMIGSLKETTTLRRPKTINLSAYLPFLDWLVHYRRDNLVGDLMAGLIVAIMLVPQGMAYAMPSPFFSQKGV